jgi:ABC-type glutathione transport system ATPase component
MSGGQQAQLALTLALARRPRLLVLDEPMAMLDPIARHDFMATVMTAVADDGVSVVLSSHVLAELERVADYLVLVSRGSVQMFGEVDDLLARHRVLTGPASESERYAQQWSVVHASRAASQAHLLVRCDDTSDPLPPGWEAHSLTLDELTLAYLREPGAVAPRRPPWPTALVALAVLFWIGGLQLHHAYAAAIACRPASSLSCSDLTVAFNGTNGFLANGFLLQAVPPLIGAFVGAPVLARETTCAGSRSPPGRWPPSRSASWPASSSAGWSLRLSPPWWPTPGLPWRPGGSYASTT